MRALPHVVLGFSLLGACGGSDDPSGAAPPSAVAGVAATVANGTVNLVWDEVPGAAAYRLYMASQSGVTRINVGTLPGNMTHTDLPGTFDHPPGLNANETYYFVVTAVNQAGESLESCEVSATIATQAATSC